MLIRRLVACACALALAVPAVAAAQPGFDPPARTQHVVYGDTKYDLQNQQDLGAPKGDTKNDLAPTAGGTVAAISALTDKQLAAAYGGPTSAIVAKPVASSPDDGTNGWRIAAVVEAGLIAAIALGSAALVGRMRPRRGAHA